MFIKLNTMFFQILYIALNIFSPVATHGHSPSKSDNLMSVIQYNGKNVKTPWFCRDEAVVLGRGELRAYAAVR